MSLWRRLAANFAWLLGGQGLAILLTLGATTLCARTLGASDFGIVMMLQAGALLVRQFCNFRTAEAAVRFGVAEHQDADPDRWPSLLAGLFRLDLVGMVVAMAVIACICLAGEALRPELFPSTSWMYVFAATGFVGGTAKGALRVLNRYELLGLIEAAGPLVRFTGVAIAAWFDAPVEYFVMVFALALWVDHGIVLFPAWTNLRDALKSGWMTHRRQKLAVFEGLRGFLTTVYWQSNVDALMRQGPTLLVGALLSTADAGIYRLTRDIADVVRKPVALIRQAIFPDLARLWIDRPTHFLRFALQVCGLLLTVGIVVLLLVVWLGRDVLALLGGAEFAVGQVLLMLLVGAAVLELPGATLRPAIYTLGGERHLFALSVGVLVIYVAFFVGMVRLWELETAGYSSIAAFAIGLGGHLLILLSLLRRPATQARLRAS